MIDSVFNLLFGCRHQRLSRPVSPVGKSGKATGEPYVVCLECGKRFAYDIKEMRIGKALENPAPSRVLPAATEQQHPQRRFLLWASIPFALLVSSLIKHRKRK